MGYESGSLSGRGSDEKYNIDSFRIGKCLNGDLWESCSGGCNDYQEGGACSNNPEGKCDETQAVKITIQCRGGENGQSSSCAGKNLSIINLFLNPFM